jgi:hypothetical protein
MNPVRSGPRAILLSLALALLIIGSAQWVAVVAVYVMEPPPAEPDSLILVVLAALTLGPCIALGLATRRARVVARTWDLGKVGGNVLMFVSILMVAILGIAGLYPVVRLMKTFVAH